ncbi:T9SS type A sorting domain-containing protein [Flavobacterium sp.]
MKKILYLFLFLSAHCFSQVPAIQWQTSLGGSREENAYSVLQTPDGGYIFSGRANSGNGDVVGYQWNYDLFNGDVWIVKTDAAGTIQWQKLYGGHSNDGGLKIIPTSDGGYAVACVSNSSNGTVTTYIGGYDYWILKLDSAGELQWQKRLGGTGDDHIRDIKQTADGGYIVIGYSSSNLPGTHGMKEAYVVKLSSTGTTQWWKVFGGSADDLGNTISQTADGGYILAGTTQSSNGNFTANYGMADIFLMKINAAGTIEWQKNMGGTKEDFGQSLIVLSDGSYVLSAASSSNDVDVTTTNRGSTDLWIVKMNATGTILWQKSYGGSSSDCYSESKISQTSDGGFVVCGSTISSNGDASGNHSSGIYDAWVVKLDSQGNKQWHRCYGGSGEDDGHAVIETADKGYVIAGMSRTNTSGGNGTPDWTFNASRSLDAWLIKLNPDPLLNIDEKEMAHISLYPNPADEVVNITVSDNTRIEKITVTDLLGKKVFEQNTNQPMAIQHLSKGVYLISVLADGKNYNSKLIKE